MKSNNIAPLSPTIPWPRDYVLALLSTGLAVGEVRFTRQTALTWLSSYPGDLPISLIHVKALLADERAEQALPILENITHTDPEFLEAQELLAEVHSELKHSKDTISRGCALALNSTKIPKGAVPKWGGPLWEARHAFDRGDFKTAEALIHRVLASDPATPLAAVTHLRSIAEQNAGTTGPLVQHYHQRWPKTLQIVLLLAESLMQGQSEEAVALLHYAAANDVTGQVVERLWGPDHPYRVLWPDNLQALVGTQVPASISGVFGWNLLPKGAIVNAKGGDEDMGAEMDPTGGTGEVNPMPFAATVQPPNAPPPETLQPVHETLEQLADRLQKPSVSSLDGRFPVYVLFTTRKGLRRKYGYPGAERVDAAMKELVIVIREELDWGAILMYADDPASMAKLNLKPAHAEDAWGLKLALVDLDTKLEERGSMIGAVLIVGGPEVVPFHKLPNPTDDHDVDVPSDNPYTNRDDNYFVPEWPVGRLPGQAGKDPTDLIQGLQAITAQHAGVKEEPKSLRQRISTWLSKRLLPWRLRENPSFGYTAEVWRRASLSVFRPIGERRALLTSPPSGVHAGTSIPISRLGYFNLHGLVDTAEWYGQRDPTENTKGPSFPVALRPQDVVNSGRAPQVVFSEACYGANILGKKVDEALALKFLSSGSRVVVGSTVTSYGSVSTPLNAADLLGKAFWKFLLDNYPAGEALRRAKVHLAREMDRRQGYLDGEDQKTLISFVLYGDPLATLSGDVAQFNPENADRFGVIEILRSLNFIKRAQPKSVRRSIELPVQVKTVCDRVATPGTSEPIPKEIMERVRRVVENYLPGMKNAQYALSHEQGDCCCQGHSCPTGQLGAKARPQHDPERRVVTLSKNIKDAKHIHPQYARLTLDKNGKVVKMAVSR